MNESDEETHWQTMQSVSEGGALRGLAELQRPND